MKPVVEVFDGLFLQMNSYFDIIGTSVFAEMTLHQ